MGNIASYFSEKVSMEESIGPIDEVKPVDGSHQTPARCAKSGPGNQFFDPRSPTLNFERTPILLEPECESNKAPEDPRSPSFGINRTPVIPGLQSESEALIEKEREDLIQVLNFTDLDCLSLSNIEEDASLVTEEVPEQVPQEIPVMFSEETFNLSSLVINASSTPTPSPIKPQSKSKRPVTNIVVDENSFGKSSFTATTTSPNPQKNASLAKPRVPFGDVNRPTLASPRLQLQNKQRHLVRSEILQQRYGNKSD